VRCNTSAGGLRIQLNEDLFLSLRYNGLNLRSALDLLAVDLVRCGGGTPGDYTAFPVGSDYVHFNTSAIKRVDGASADAIKLICRLKPYRHRRQTSTAHPGCRRQDEGTIWRLHRLDIADKHQLLIPVAAAHEMFGVKHDVRGPNSDLLPPAIMVRRPVRNRKFPLQNGDEVSRHLPVTDPGYEDNTEFEHGFGIAFGYGQVFDGEPVVPTLKQLIDFTERIIDIFARNIFGLTAW
jgi:hypothetical protein